MKKIICLVIASLFLTACSHIPLGTMLKFATFDEEDFKAVQAEELRVRITTNIKQAFLEGETKLRLEYKGSLGKLDEAMVLTQLESNTQTVSHWFSDDTLEKITLFKLSPDSIEAFKRIQNNPVLFKKNNDGEFIFGVSWKLEEGYPQKHLLKVELLLEPNDGFMTLIDDFEMDYQLQKRDL